ncbi:hypothetical protein MMC30_008059 [Trapelia coarctata]|nr:hypothetical protein [Trapelia coarctata]
MPASSNSQQEEQKSLDRCNNLPQVEMVLATELAEQSAEPQGEKQHGEDDPGGINEVFNERKTYYPVFCLTEVPHEYFDEFYDHANKDEIPWLEITSINLNEVIEELKANTGNLGPYPFLDCTVDQVYDIYKTHIRPTCDATGRQLITSFTLLVIDEECVRSNPKQCILCCDSPDFEEADDEVKLKQLRMPIEKVIEYLCPLEMLTMTPSDVEYLSGEGLSVFPPAFVMPFDEERPETREYRVAMPAEARFNKRVAITENLSLCAGHLITTMEAPTDECKRAAQLYKKVRESAWKCNYKVVFHGNGQES